MSFKKIKAIIQKPYFSTDELKLFFENHYKSHLEYWRKTGKVTKLINGRYLFNNTESNDVNDTFNLGYALRFELANKIYQPSYISLESALSHYQVIPEHVRVTTSISTKRTREFNTPRGIFTYQTVNSSLFFGYTLDSVGERRYLIATLEKTILDYLYLHNEIKSVDDFIEMRWDRLVLVNNLDCKTLSETAEKYTNKATQRRLSLLFDYLDV